MAEQNYTIKNLYQGGYSPLNPPNNYAKSGDFGMTTDPRTANILKEVSTKLSSGTKHMELALVQPKIFDAIPNEQLKEVKRLSEVTGIDVSVHGPVIDTTGITQNGWSELNREASERVVTNALERSHQVSNKGNVPVVFHSAEGIPGSDWKTLGSEKERKAKKFVAIDRDKGQMIPIEEEAKFYPGKGMKEIPMSPEEGIQNANATKWSNELAVVEFEREKSQKIIENVLPTFRRLYIEVMTGKRDPKTLAPEEIQHFNKIFTASEHAQQASLKLNGLFDDAVKYVQTDEEKKFLIDLSKAYAEKMGFQEGKRTAISLDPKIQSDAMLALVQGLQKVNPEIYVPIEKFAIEKSSQTFGNSAFNAYKKFKDKAPVMCIENPPAGFALSTGEDLKNLIEASRKQFVKQAVKEGVLSEKQAEKQAEKLIGAAWDVGHINMLRKSGFKEKDILKESERIAPMVKHVHLSDNFGLEHTELPMGMGNVPMKEIMKRLGQKGFEAKKIIEAGDWWQHFQTPPLQETLEYFGTPIYTSGATPYWNQAPGFTEGYLGGYGNMLPQINYETFGAGFSQLPAELGGQRAGAQGSRMSGRKME